jgi:Uma2 family endonuclease
VGAPDLAVEILSKSSSAHDRVRKRKLYLRSGVREYWIVDPDSRTVLVHLLKDGVSSNRIYADSEMAPVHVLDGCTIDLRDVFKD